MSLTTFKKKSVIQYGSRRSGKPPAGIWLPQGPFGRGGVNSVMLSQALDGVAGGFSINGGRRSISVGQTQLFSHNGTPFRGIYPRGHGGFGGQYVTPEPVFNSNVVITRGTEGEFIKPSVLSTRGMLRQKYRYLYSGQYPNYWVQPNYGSSNLSDNASQGMYVQAKSAANDCVVDVNNSAVYEGHVVRCGPCGCNGTPARGYKMNLQMSNAPYTKALHIPQTSGQHTLRIQRQCANPTEAQKPFPGATNGGVCNNTRNIELRAPSTTKIE